MSRIKVRLKPAGRKVEAEHGVVSSFPDDFLAISAGRRWRGPSAGF